MHHENSDLLGFGRLLRACNPPLPHREEGHIAEKTAESNPASDEQGTGYNDNRSDAQLFPHDGETIFSQSGRFLQDLMSILQKPAAAASSSTLVNTNTERERGESIREDTRSKPQQLCCTALHIREAYYIYYKLIPLHITSSWYYSV